MLIGRRIKFKSKYTRNKDVVGYFWASPFEVTLKNYNNVINAIASGLEYEVLK